MYLIRPFIVPVESLTSYLFRLGKENGYERASDLFNPNKNAAEAFTWSNMMRNTFSTESLNGISRMTRRSVTELNSLTFNCLLQEIGADCLIKLTYRETTQFCPICLNKTFQLNREWSYRPIDMCSLHHIVLTSTCSNCGWRINMRDLYKEVCRRCGTPLNEGSRNKGFGKITTECKLRLNKIISETDAFRLTPEGRSYKLREFLILARRSQFLIRGAGSLTEEIEDSETAEKHVPTQYCNVVWMYNNFPSNFISVLDGFYKRRRATERYAEKGEFEQLFQTGLFPQVKNEYLKFWDDKTARRAVKGVSNTVPAKDTYISKQNAAIILGISYRYINALIRLGIIQKMNQEQLVSQQEIQKLLVTCTGQLSESTKGRITIRDIQKMYPTKGLSLVNIICFIMSGFLKPEKSAHSSTILDATFNDQDVTYCLQLFRITRKIKLNEVKVMRNNNVQLGMATITAKGLIHNSKAYSNPAMIKHQWFEHAEKFGDWQCPVGYFPENPDHVVLFDAQGLEVATSIENQQHPDAAVLEAYYDAINNLKERLAEVKVWHKKNNHKNRDV